MRIPCFSTTCSANSGSACLFGEGGEGLGFKEAVGGSDGTDVGGKK